MHEHTRDVALIGKGYWGANLARNLDALGRLALIVDENPSTLEQAAKEYPSARCSSNMAAALQDPAIKAVFIAAPAVTHADIAQRALEAGKDVFVEKPLALEPGSADRLVALAADRKRILMVGHILRYHPAVKRLEQLIREGALGQIRYLYSNRLNIGKIRTEENILWSFAPHDISVMLALLNEEPSQVACQGGSYLSENVADVTLSQFVFRSGVRAHIFVSWLHPFKEQRLVVVGSEKMAVFDDTAEHKLVLYPHKVAWKNRVPTAVKAEAEVIAIEPGEPLRAECQHFLDCVETRRAPLTDGAEGTRVLRVLDACQRSLQRGGGTTTLHEGGLNPRGNAFVHETAIVHPDAVIGRGTKVWHFSHIMKGARIGEHCILGQNVNVADGAAIGNHVKIQNNVSIYAGVTIEDEVFLGPSCVLTNVSNPRSEVNRHALYETSVLKRGCTIGANATLVCGVTIGRYAFVGAGSVVTHSVPDYALVTGNPGRVHRWMSRHGQRLPAPGPDGIMVCPESGYRYREVEPGVVRCLDLDENAPLPPDKAVGAHRYREYQAGISTPVGEEPGEKS